MKPEFREQLAHLPFEEKIRKVGELIRLSRDAKISMKTASSGSGRLDDIKSHPQGRASRADEVRQLFRLARDVKHQPLRGSLKGTKAMDVFTSKRKLERG